MIDLYYWTTPNGHKITIFLEEANLPYRIFPINIGAGEQFNPNFLKISPNNKIPAIIDHNPSDGSGNLSMFESGTILLYLAEKTGKYIPMQLKPRVEVIQWLCWQISGLGPMAGQNHHFTQYTSQKIPYAIDRYVNETARLYAVLNKQLENKEFIAEEYSIADMACYPWIYPYKKQQQNLDEFPNLKRWFTTMQTRPAVQRAYAKSLEVNPKSELTEAEKKILFNQNANTIADYLKKK
jgi:GST-like protein